MTNCIRISIISAIIGHATVNTAGCVYSPAGINTLHSSSSSKLQQTMGDGKVSTPTSTQARKAESDPVGSRVSSALEILGQSASPADLASLTAKVAEANEAAIEAQEALEKAQLSESTAIGAAQQAKASADAASQALKDAQDKLNAAIAESSQTNTALQTATTAAAAASLAQAQAEAAAANAANAKAVADAAKASADVASQQANLTVTKTNALEAAVALAQATSTSAGSVAQSASAQANSALLRAQQTISVKDFGAKGDGQTDDTGAIQNAINSLATGGTVVIPRGAYRLTSDITLPASNLQIVGEQGAILRGYGIVTSGNTEISNIHVQQLLVDLQGRSGSLGITLRKVTNSQLDLVQVMNAGAQINSYNTSDLNGGTAFLCYDSSNIVFKNCIATNIGGGGTYRGDGFYCANSSGITYENCLANTVGRHGFAATNAFGTASTFVRYIGCTSQNTALSGIDAEIGSQLSIRDHAFKNCGTYLGYYDPATVYGPSYRLRTGVALSPDCVDSVIDGCTFDSNYFGLMIGKASNVRFINNTIRNSVSDAITQGGLAQGGQNITISNNFIYGPIGTIYSGKDWSINNNLFYGTGAGTGLDFLNCSRIEVRGNNIYDFNTGILFRNNLDTNTTDGNCIYGCTTPLSLYASSSNISNNSIQRNLFSANPMSAPRTLNPYAISISELTGASIVGINQNNVISGYSQMYNTVPQKMLTRLNLTQNQASQIYSSLDSGFLAYLGTNQNLPGNIPTAVNLDTIDFDRATEFDTAGHRWKSKSSGQYQFSASCQFQSAQIGERIYLSLWKNGNLEYRLGETVAQSASALTLSGSILLNLAANDTVELRALSSTGNTLKASPTFTWLTGVRQ